MFSELIGLFDFGSVRVEVLRGKDAPLRSYASRHQQAAVALSFFALPPT